jgi:hypothetical protein
MDYFLARKQIDSMVFACGDNPLSVNTGFSIDRAKRFDSPGDALAFRAGMQPHLQDKFIVHELDGNLLQSLDV